jgi:hypothetical protein
MLFRTIYSHMSSLKTNYELNNQNILFIWIPKTAGTTIFKTLENTFGMQKRKRQKEFLSFPNKGAVTFNHVSYFNLREIGAVSHDYHLNSYKFCFVRNPYMRAISLYNFLRQEKIIRNELGFEAFLDEVHLHRPPIGLYNYRGISPSNPQSDWVTSDDGKLLVDDVFKIEEIDKFLLTFEKKFKKKINLSKKLNESKKIIFFEDISQNTSILKKIELIYARDFDLFGYNRIS